MKRCNGNQPFGTQAHGDFAIQLRAQTAMGIQPANLIARTKEKKVVSFTIKSMCSSWTSELVTANCWWQKGCGRLVTRHLKFHSSKFRSVVTMDNTPLHACYYVCQAVDCKLWQQSCINRFQLSWLLGTIWHSCLVNISFEPRSEASMISQGPQGCLARASFVQATTDHQAVNSESSCVSTQLWNLN